MAQVWIYNRALGRIQGYLPPASYLLGRSWRHGESHEGKGCLEQIARVDDDRVIADRGPLSEIVANALDWVRRVRGQGASWSVLPTPSVPELFPHARNTEDAPWHGAKSQIARELAELTLVPGMTPRRRAAALALGLGRWDDPSASAALLDVPNHLARRTDAVLDINRSLDGPVVQPAHLGLVGWRRPAALEFFIDFETVNSLDDDFSRLPAPNGQPLIFQIGCGWMDSGEWKFAQWTVDAMTEAEEGRIIAEWLDTMSAELKSRGLTYADSRLIHWSPAETSSLTTAYNSARARHPGANWPLDLPWLDFLSKVIREEPVVVRGAFNFGLKSVAKAMHAAGLIETVWSDGPTDGLGAMVGAFWCAAESAKTGVPMSHLPLMIEIAGYNEVDCRAMADVVGWLRANR